MYEIEDWLLEMILIVAFLSCLGLIYYLVTNPAYFIGKTRAAIEVTNEEGTKTTSNPHLFAKSGYGGLVVAIFLLRKYKTFIHKIILGFFIFFFIIILAITQSMSTVIATALFFGAYSYFHFPIKRLINVFFKWQLYAITFLVILWYAIYYSGSTFENYTQYLSGIIITRAEKVYNTFFVDKSKLKKSEIDDSANGRYDSVGQVFDNLEHNLENHDYVRVLFGNGYQSSYIDFPVAQSYQDLGILGLIAFIGLHIYLVLLVLKEMRNPTSLVKSYFAYFIILIFVNQLTGGMPYDYNRYVALAFIIRFFKPIQNSIKIATAQ